MLPVVDAVPGLSELLKVISTNVDRINTVRDNVNAVSGRQNTSIAEAIRDTMVVSSAYTEQAVVDEDIYPALLSVLHQIYAAYIITAVGLNQHIGETRVRDILRQVSTEGFANAVELVEAKFDDPRLDMPVINARVNVSTESSGTSVIDLEPSSSRLPAGKVIDITFVLGDKGGAKELKVLMYIQLNPVSITTDVADNFISLNFTDSLRRRWMRMRAGEIRFISDFLFQRYELKKLDTALRADKTDTLANMMHRQQNALAKALLNSIQTDEYRRTKGSENLATATLIVSKPTFDRACKLAGVDFNRTSDRNTFFSRSMMLMVVVVDSNYAMAEIYTHGLDTVGSYPFKTIEKGSKNAIDLKDVMTLMSRGSAPRF